MNSWLPQNLSGAFRALLCILPPGRLWECQKLGIWALLCYLTLDPLLLFPAEQKNQWDTTWNLLSHFLEITAALVCRLQLTLSHRNVACHSFPALSPQTSPAPCLHPKVWIWKAAVPWAGCWELSGWAGRKTCRFLLGRYHSCGTVPEA